MSSEQFFSCYTFIYLRNKITLLEKHNLIFLDLLKLLVAYPEIAPQVEFGHLKRFTKLPQLKNQAFQFIECRDPFCYEIVKALERLSGRGLAFIQNMQHHQLAERLRSSLGAVLGMLTCYPLRYRGLNNIGYFNQLSRGELQCFWSKWRILHQMGTWYIRWEVIQLCWVDSYLWWRLGGRFSLPLLK